MALANIKDRKLYYECRDDSADAEQNPLLLINGMGGS